MNYEFRIEISVQENCSPFKPNVTRYEFIVEAEQEIDAIKIASGKVPTKGHPYDTTSVRVLWSKPLFDEAAEVARIEEAMKATDHLNDNRRNEGCVMLITDPLYVRYVDPSACDRPRKGHCFMCGAPDSKKGCLCRYCTVCERYWLASERAEKQEQDCAVCVSEESRAA